MKRLIVCCDGTWQDLNTAYPTNVVKLVQALKSTAPAGNESISQITYYDEGLGTSQGIKTSDLINRIGGGALGLGIDHKIQSAYRFICLNYEPNDEIYLFGFSRGAYIVRSLAGLIYNSGLLKREHIRKVSEAYEVYRGRDKDCKPNGPKSLKFRQENGITYFPPQGKPEEDCGRVSIKALGCWDTVCSLGIPKVNILGMLRNSKIHRERYEFHDDRVNRLVEHAFHAVAIDEKRSVFDVTLMEPHDENHKNQILQVWFPGFHGCVGGGFESAKGLKFIKFLKSIKGIESVKGLSDIALLWMMDQVESLGLALDAIKVTGGIEPNYKTGFEHEQPTGISSKLGNHLRPSPSKCSDSGRPVNRLIPRESLHSSVIQRWQDPEMDYRPKNLSHLSDYLDAALVSSEKNNKTLLEV